MLLWAILLQTVPMRDSDPVPRAFPRLLDLAGQACRDAAECGGDPPRRYRLETRSLPIADSKIRALRGEWKACGTTGAPVCPSRGRLTFRDSF